MRTLSQVSPFFTRRADPDPHSVVWALTSQTFGLLPSRNLECVPIVTFGLRAGVARGRCDWLNAVRVFRMSSLINVWGDAVGLVLDVGPLASYPWAGFDAIGRLIVKEAPRSGPLDCAEISPWWASTMARAIVRPIPDPWLPPVVRLFVRAVSVR